MSYCKDGEKPKVTFDFNGKTPTIYESIVAPIDVSTSSASDPNVQGQIYAWNLSTARNPRTTLDQMPFRAKGKFTSFTAVITSTDTVNGVMIGSWYCTFKDGDGNTISGSAIGNYPNDVPILVQLPLDNTQPPINTCNIEVKDSTGTVLFSKSGECPVNYTVACDGRCPEGSCECHSDSYPGYCCNDCGGEAARVHGIANELRDKVNASQLPTSTV